MSIEYMTPVSARRQPVDYGSSVSLTWPPRVIGMLGNGFPGAEKYLERQADALSNLLPDAKFRFEVKGGPDDLNGGIREPLLSDMAAECDAMVFAWGHCGSCTSGLARDAIAFAGFGIPSVQLICDVFWPMSEWIGGALGMINLPRVQIPYPVAGTSESFQRELAARIAPELVAKLRVSAALRRKVAS